MTLDEYYKIKLCFSVVYIFLEIYLAVLGPSCGLCVMWDLSLRQVDSLVVGAGSVVVAHGASCSTACRVLVPQPGIEPTSPPLQGVLLITGPPGKSQYKVFFN